MKKQFLTVLISLAIFVSCQHIDGTSSAEKVDIHKTVLKSFSNVSKQDTFLIELIGKKPLEMSLVFTIKNFSGKEIYHQVFKAADIINNYKHTVNLEKEAEQMQFLKQEVNLFFEDENFLEPAITNEEVPDKNAVDKVFYEELKKSGLNGFKYRLGNETKVYIGWSAIDHKVKIYYKCC